MGLCVCPPESARTPRVSRRSDAGPSRHLPVPTPETNPAATGPFRVCLFFLTVVCGSTVLQQGRLHADETEPDHVVQSL